MNRSENKLSPIKGSDNVVPAFNPFRETTVRRLYGTEEPTVINKPLLLAAIYDQGPKEEAGKIAQTEGIEFSSVIELSLSFQGILKIENLKNLTNLTKLQLDNNVIEKIEHLSQLVKLKWLDLSFNKITKIENLDALTQLEDLSLFQNDITVIENLDHLKNLKFLSIGRNQLSDKTNLLYLRRLKKLESLNIEDNPFCSESDLVLYIFAYLAQINYINYKFIIKEWRTMAYEKFQISVDQMNEAQLEQDQQDEEMAQLARDRIEYAKAFIDELEGDNLFHSVFSNDPEGQQFLKNSSINEVVDQYREKLADYCRQLFIIGTEEYNKRNTEEILIRQCVNDAKLVVKEESMAKIKEFLDYKNQVMSQIDEFGERTIQNCDVQLTEYRNRISELLEQLMQLEIGLADQLEEVIKDFERSMTDLVNNFIESTQNYMSKCREAATSFNERFIGATLSYADRLMKTEQLETEEEIKLYTDRDSLLNALVMSRDAHLLKVDQCEESILRRANRWLSNLISDLHTTEETERHTKRVTEINLFIDAQRVELDMLDLATI